MNIRIAVEADLQAIFDIYNQAIAEGGRTGDTTPVTLADRTAWFREHNTKHPIYVAEIENTVVGYLSLSPYRPGRMALRFTAEVSYYIHYAHHRQGIASKLLTYALKQSSSLQFKSLLAIIMESNAASIQLLGKHGFEKWGYLPRVADFAGVEVSQVIYGKRV